MKSKKRETLKFASYASPNPSKPVANTPTSYLVILPEDSLGSIGSYAGLIGVTRLINCGSSLLTAKLNSRHCVLNLWYNCDEKRLKALLPYLSRMKGLIGMNFLGEVSIPSIMNWSTFSKSLRHFRHDSMKTVDLERFHDQVTYLSDFETFSLCWKGGISQLVEEKTRAMSALGKILLKMTNLRALRLGPKLLPEMSCIPSTVVELDYGTTCINFMELELVPFMLTKLVLKETTTIYVPAHMNQLPALESLDISNSTLSFCPGVDTETLNSVEETFFKSFPSLTELNISSLLLPQLSKMVDTTKATLPSFWDNLKSLGISGLADRFPLPSSLTSLSARLGQNLDSVNLPRSLRYLELPHTKVTSFDKFPPSLVKLSAAIDLRAITMIDLPNLTHLEAAGSSYPDGVEEFLPLFPESLILLDLLDLRGSGSCLRKVVRTPSHLKKPNAPSNWISFFSACESAEHMNYLRSWGNMPPQKIVHEELDFGLQNGMSPRHISSLVRYLSDYPYAKVDLTPTLKRQDRLEIYKAIIVGKFQKFHIFSDFFQHEVLKTGDFQVMDYLMDAQVLNLSLLWDFRLADKWEGLVGWFLSRGALQPRDCIQRILGCLISHGRSIVLEVTKTLQRISSGPSFYFDQNEFDLILGKIIREEPVLDNLVLTLEIVLAVFQNHLPRPVNLAKVFKIFLNNLSIAVLARLDEPIERKVLEEPFSEKTLLWFSSRVDILLESSYTGFSAVHAVIAVKSPLLLSILSGSPLFLEAGVVRGTGTFQDPLQFAKLWSDARMLPQVMSLFPSSTFAPQGMSETTPRTELTKMPLLIATENGDQDEPPAQRFLFSDC